MRRPRFSVLWMLLAIAVLATACGGTPPPQTTAPTQASVATQQPAAPAVQPVKLVVLTHWGEESVLKPMQEKLDQYTKDHPNVTIEYQTVTFDQLLTKITTARAAGISPDIYHFYNLWAPEFVKGGMLDTPPDDVIADVKANYALGSIDAVSTNGAIWGYPTEVNTYQLIYNKRIFGDAGITAPPETWDQLIDTACKLKVVDSTGAVTQAGFVGLPGWDSGVVHPFLSLLWSGGGEYLNADGSKTLFNDAKGMSVLKLYMDMIDQGCMDPALNMGDFASGKGGMIIMANWWGATLKTSFTDGFDNVGVAPIPHGPDGDSTSIQYNWMFGVDANSKQQEEAWKLVKWLNTPAKEGEASPIGEFLTGPLGAVPSRLSDQAALTDRINTPFMKPFVDAATNAKPEPVVAGGQEVKTTLQTNIEAAWYGQKTAEVALRDAAEEADRILAEKK